MDIRRRFLSKKSSGGSSGGDSSGTYTVNLNSQWEKTTAVTNPDSSLYDGVYRSTSNYNVHNTAAIMYIDISGLTSFKLYIRSYAESSWDYVMVSQLDQTINNSTSYSNTSLVKAHTQGNQQSGTALSSYTLVEFTGIDGGSHRITVVYRKDGSANSGDDRGYVLIPYDQSSQEEGGDVDIDTTYSIMYASSDGKVVTPYMTNVFGANITSNNYVDGQGIITFDAPVTKIGYNAFRGCKSLTSITIPNSITEIGYQTFYNCTSLTSVTIGNSVTSIGEYAFWSCTSLTSITIPDSVTSIGDYAFFGCSSLANVTIGNSVTSIGEHAFLDCRSLKNITIPDSVTSIGNSAFDGCSSLKAFYGKYASPDNRCLIVNDILNSFAIGCGLTEYTIPDSVTSIGEEAFYWCTSLMSVTIPNSVTSIGGSAFYNCSSLTSVTIPNSVTSIGGYTFRFCKSLTSITIPNSVTSIGSNAFSGCSSLTSVYCKPTTPPTGGSYMFDSNATNRIIYVPTASVNAYKSASGWSDYADYIVGYDFSDDGGGSSELITFTIDGVQYQAEEGMT